MSNQPPGSYPPYPGQDPSFQQQSGYTQYPSQQGYQPTGYAPQVYPPYGVPLTPPDKGNGFAIAGLVLGIVGIIAAFFPICGVPIAIVGIIMSAIGTRSLSYRTMAIVGIVLCSIAIVISIFITVLAMIGLAMPQHK